MALSQSALARNMSAPADPIEVFRERAWATAKLLEYNLVFNKADAADALWRYAVGNGVIDAIGVDAAQAILAEAFSKC